MVKVSVQEKRAAWGQGYFFFVVGVLLADDVALLEVVIGAVWSFLIGVTEGAVDSEGSDVGIVADNGVWKACGDIWVAGPSL